MIQKEENNLQFLYKNPHPHKVTAETDIVIQDTEFGFKCGVLQVTDSAVTPPHTILPPRAHLQMLKVLQDTIVPRGKNKDLDCLLLP